MKDKANLFKGYERISILTFSMILIGALGLGYLQFHDRLAYEQEHVKEQFERSISSLELITASCTQHIESMQLLANEYYVSLDNKNSHYLYQYLEYDTNLKYSHLNVVPPKFEQDLYANLTGNLDIKAISEDKKREINMALKLNPLFQAAKKSIPNSAWAYYVSSDFINIYPWVASPDFHFTEEVLSHEFYTNSRPERNPDRKIFWTRPYKDEAGLGWMVTCAAPIYDRDRFKGSVAIDITLGELSNVISKSQLKIGEIFLVEGDSVLAHPKNAPNTAKKMITLQDILPQDVYKDFKGFSQWQPQEMLLIDGYYIYYEDLPHAPWKIVYVASASETYMAMMSTTGLILLAATLCILFVLIYSNFVIRRDFIRPSQNLIIHLQNENANFRTKYANIPKAWEIWFEIITDIFQTKRDLHNQLRKHADTLEQQVEDRTIELVEKTEELLTKNEAMIATERQILKKSHEVSRINQSLTLSNAKLTQSEYQLHQKNGQLEHASKKINSSISYAQKIQNAILADKEVVFSQFKEGFIFAKAKDIVTGDFHWFSKVTHHVFFDRIEVQAAEPIANHAHNPEIARLGYDSVIPENQSDAQELQILIAGDCTGHGVPGAFMTVMANDLLNAIVNEKHITQPAQILYELDKKVSGAFENEGARTLPDGMDMSICVIDKKNKKLRFSGAKNPLFWIRNGELTVIKGSKSSIGSSSFKTKKVFETHTIAIEENDIFYLFSDGYQDQFGGKNDTKYLTKNFRKLLLDISPLPMVSQEKYLEREFNEWKGEQEQTDDILIIGFKI